MSGPRFRILRELGRGSMGLVFLAEDRQRSVPVAVKILHPETESPRAMARLRREAEILKRLEHPHLIRVVDLLEAPGKLALVLEFLPGETLAQRLSRGPLSDPEARQLMLQVAAALTALHRQQVVHRDLKPSNLMIRKDGSFVVMDLGLARDPDSPRLTASQSLLGTPRYMSPEMLRGEPAGPESDFFQLGSILFEARSGEKLLAGDFLDELAENLIRGRFRPLPEAVRAESPWLGEVLARCLELDPLARPRSVQDLEQLFESCEVALGETQEVDAGTLSEVQKLDPKGTELGLPPGVEPGPLPDRDPSNTRATRVLDSRISRALPQTPLGWGLGGLGLLLLGLVGLGYLSGPGPSAPPKPASPFGSEAPRLAEDGRLRVRFEAAGTLHFEGEVPLALDADLGPLFLPLPESSGPRVGYRFDSLAGTYAGSLDLDSILAVEVPRWSQRVTDFSETEFLSEWSHRPEEIPPDLLPLVPWRVLATWMPRILQSSIPVAWKQKVFFAWQRFHPAETFLKLHQLLPSQWPERQGRGWVFQAQAPGPRGPSLFRDQGWRRSGDLALDEEGQEVSRTRARFSLWDGSGSFRGKGIRKARVRWPSASGTDVDQVAVILRVRELDPEMYFALRTPGEEGWGLRFCHPGGALGAKEVFAGELAWTLPKDFAPAPGTELELELMSVGDTSNARILTTSLLVEGISVAFHQRPTPQGDS